MMENWGALGLGLGLGWVTLALGLILLQPARRWWRKRRYGEPINHGLLLVETGRKLTGVQDHEALGRMFIEELPTEFGAWRAALLLPDEHELVSVVGQELELPISHAAVRRVASGGEAQRANRGGLARLIGQGRADLSWTRIWVPLMRGTRLRGLWLLGRREGGLDYAPEDLRCLTSIAREAAAVLEAMSFAEQEHQAALEMRALYRQLIAAREEERGRLTRELHDGVLQDLCAVTRDLRALESRGDSQKPPYDDLVVRSGEAVKALRAICSDLRPPLLRQDLATALEALVQDLDSRSSAPVFLETQVDGLQLGDEAALAVFRITQEALNNAILHADASEIAVRLTQYPDRLRLTVTDDGRGIAGSADPARLVARGHFGLAGMRERAAMVGGTLDVQTAIDYGTVVVLEIPL
jgi:signal transduction histidine kinase